MSVPDASTMTKSPNDVFLTAYPIGKWCMATDGVCSLNSMHAGGRAGGRVGTRSRRRSGEAVGQTSVCLQHENLDNCLCQMCDCRSLHKGRASF